MNNSLVFLIQEVNKLYKTINNTWSLTIYFITLSGPVIFNNFNKSNLFIVVI